MSEAYNNNSAVTAIRDEIREKIKIARIKRRQNDTDQTRVSLGELNGELSSDLVTVEEVKEFAAAIREKRRASPEELVKIAHASLQSAENIEAFVNTPGALSVIVKEFTGTKSETQMLAAECVCNLSLGSEGVCEKVAQQAASYLHTFLKSPNESLIRTSLWTMTNLIASGRKASKILFSQEIIKTLINVMSTSLTFKEEACTAIELILNYHIVPQKSDVKTLWNWILEHPIPLHPQVTRIAYKLVESLQDAPDELTEINLKHLVKISFDTFCHLYERTSAPEVKQTELDECLQQVIVLMRVCAIACVLERSCGNIIIEEYFYSSSRPMAPFFNHFVDLFLAKNLKLIEIYCFLSDVTGCPISKPVLTYMIEDQAFFDRLKIIR